MAGPRRTRKIVKDGVNKKPVKTAAERRDIQAANGFNLDDPEALMRAERRRAREARQAAVEPAPAPAPAPVPMQAGTPQIPAPPLPPAPVAVAPVIPAVHTTAQNPPARHSYRPWPHSQQPIDRHYEEGHLWQAASTNPVNLFPEHSLARWSKGMQIGKGGQGTATLYAALDENHMPVDTVVLKLSHMNALWYDSVTSWYGSDLRDPAQRVPIEIAAMDILKQTTPNYCVQMRGYQVYHKQRVSAIVMDYYPLETLFEAYNRYARRNEHIPEPAVVAIFYGLIKACMSMASGTGLPVPADPGRDAEEEEIVHRDIKPDNIFLREAFSGERFAAHPAPILADFGLCLISKRQGDPFNPGSYHLVGTDGWRATEQLQWIRRHTVELIEIPMSSKTNIWGIAALMRFLMNAGGAVNGRDPIRPQNHQFLTTSSLRLYSPDLINLVERCSNWHPQNRPDLSTILTRLTGLITQGTELPDISQGTSSADAVLAADDPRGLMTEQQELRWQFAHER